MVTDYLDQKSFDDINLQDPFFDSLRERYCGFDGWFQKKANSGDVAFVSYSETNQINAFLYLKEENGPITDITPSLPAGKHLKIGTFKIIAHQASTSNRFMAIILRKLVSEGYDDAYVTMFPDIPRLRQLFEKFGFSEYGSKPNSQSGVFETVLRKTLDPKGDIFSDYPRFDLKGRKYLMSILPKYHTLMVPDSKLHTERNFNRPDVSNANSVVKTYLTSMQGVAGLQHNDKLVLYRTAEKNRAAEYTAVATSICVVDQCRNISSFPNESEFLDFASRGSVFTFKELKYFWSSKKYSQVVSFLYNVPLEKRITRHDLLSEGILDSNKRSRYFGFLELDNSEFDSILRRGEVNERFIID